MVEKQYLEDITRELCRIFEVYAPPVPIELMLQKPSEGLWEKVDVAQLSGSFLSIKERYSPRMSLARLLARHIAGSEWGAERKLNSMVEDNEQINTFARILTMPEDMVLRMARSARNPKTMSLHFEVPEEDARQRLLDL